MVPAIYSLSTSTRQPGLRRPNATAPLVLGVRDEQSIGAGHERIYLGSSQKPWV